MLDLSLVFDLILYRRPLAFRLHNTTPSLSVKASSFQLSIILESILNLYLISSTMRLTPLFLISTSFAAVLDIRNDGYNDLDPSFNIFKDSKSRFEGAICKSEITTKQFPNLVIPPNFRGGCVRCKSSHILLLSHHSSFPDLLKQIKY